MPSQAKEPMDLFPIPKPVQSHDLPTPQPLPGATPSSTATLREVLRKDYDLFHCFYNTSGFHNHTAHTAIALWYLGADSDILKAGFETQAACQRKKLNFQGSINKDDWTHHLGDENYYNAYLAFFINELANKGPSATLEEYVFSNAANFPGGDHQAEMLSRFVGGVLHPLIHVGYGFELGLPGMIAEGLAQAAVHPVIGSKLVPDHWFNATPKSSKVNTTPSVLNILAWVIADPKLPQGLQDSGQELEDVVELYSVEIGNYVNAWTLDLSTNEGLRKVVEEVVFFASVAYAVPGLVSKEGGTFNADFFTMHFVTSSMFLSSLLVHLEPKSQELLLRSYVSACLSVFIYRGKPQLNIEAFFSNESSLKSLFDRPLISRPTLRNVPVESRKSSNPWTSVLDEAVVHPDDHVPKIQRTLSHFAQVYGNLQPGHFKGLELNGAEKIDGTLFMRAANLTAFRLNDGRTKQKVPGGVESWWDRTGYLPKT